jgi:hypothetical protein
MNVQYPLSVTIRAPRALRLARTLLPLVAVAAIALGNPSAASACAQSGHAWFDYTQPGATSVNRGGAIWLSAAGVVGTVQFTFRGPSGAAFVYTTHSANGNCVVNQELVGVDFIPDAYTLSASFQDGNTNRQVIDAYAGTLTIVEPATPPANTASCGQPAHVFLVGNTVRTGGTIVAGGVVFPGTFSQIRLKDSVNKVTVASYYLPPAGSNCVENQRVLQILLQPGDYIIRADFIDQNNILHNDNLGTLTVTP